MRKFLSTLLTALFAGTVSALPAGIEVEDSGAMMLGGIRAAVKIYDQQWRSTLQGAKSVRCEPTYPARYGKLFKLDGTLQFSGTEGFTFQQRLTETAADTVDYSFTLKSTEGIPCRSVALSLRLPARDFEGKKLLIDGKPVAIASVSRPFRNHAERRNHPGGETQHENHS